MPESSKYIQLSSSVLMEYVYSDQDSINVPGNPYRISTNTAPIWKMSNGHNGKDQILNGDSSEFIQSGLPIGTGNVRNRSFAIIDPYKSALLDINKLIFYNDYDPLLTNTIDLPINFNSPQSPVYDTIKLHLVQGFNFENRDGLVLSIKAKRKDGTQFILCNLAYNRSDVREISNPNPFLFGGRSYSTYIEVRVLSLYNLINDYWIGTLTGDTVVERITDFNGVLRNQQITIDFAFIDSREIIDGQEFIKLIDAKTLDIRVRDQFETVSGFIEESSSGDYIEYYATFNGDIIENYILDLNNNGGDYILLHDLVVSEYVFDPSSQSYSWIKTDTLETVQTDNFDRPNFFRPIIKNSSSIAYKIDYTVRLYNREDNSQVWKTASMISNEAAKYGRSLNRINLGSNPIQTKIYNQRVVKDVKINNIQPPVINNTKYITSLSTNANISITAESINIIAGSESDSLIQRESLLQDSDTSNLRIYPNGLGRILIPDSTVFLKFNVFQKVKGVNRSINLSGLGKIILAFNSDQGEDIEFENYPNAFTTTASGEIVFRLTEQNTDRILKLNDRTFRIFLKNETGDKTFLYTGEFFSTTEMISEEKENKIINLENQISGLGEEILSLTQLTETQQDTISKLISENKKLNSNLSESLSDENIIRNQEELNRKYSDIIEDLQDQVSELNKKLKDQINQIAIENGIPQIDIPEEVESRPKESIVAGEIKLSNNKASIKKSSASSQTLNIKDN